ncbi:putative ribonuclease H-like domain-containing protein [Tanacetum coccineum]|uniref:Ribonuclease H-like domain-containing protein n=1 Tax=Tanacetum coccineum TaxID=301880 RepID=A0ABQ4ZI37_9ASTR
MESSTKPLDETSYILTSFITGIENLVDHKVKVIRCDNGTEFKNREMNQFCEMKGILRQFSVARTPQQNGVTERRNKTLIEAARTMLLISKVAQSNGIAKQKQVIMQVKLERDRTCIRKIKEEVYVCQPPGFEDPNFPDRVYKMISSLVQQRRSYAMHLRFCGVSNGCKKLVLYRKIKEEVYVCQPLGFEDPNFPDRVYKV